MNYSTTNKNIKKKYISPSPPQKNLTYLMRKEIESYNKEINALKDPKCIRTRSC